MLAPSESLRTNERATITRALADEPTASLDTERGLGVMRLLRRLSDEHGTAVLVVTHDTRMIGEVDRVIRLTDGQIADGAGDASARA